MGRRRQPKSFVAVDGEGWTIDGEHRYVLLCDSTGRHVVDDHGLSTKACFDFLVSLPRDCIPVAFGLNYDVNMMLRDIGRARLQELWTDGSTTWFDYNVEWIPGKWFYVSKGTLTKRNNAPRAKVFETFGFFQSSFVKALKAWDIPVQDMDELEAMKAARSDFDPELMPRIIEYCHTECDLLVNLMDGLRDALTYIGITINSWNGAGAIAAAVLRKRGVKGHLVHQQDLPKEIQHATLSAYFGGRTELFQQGAFETLSQYDIRSAYPAAAVSLPSLTGSEWIHRGPTESGGGIERHSIYRVEWDIPYAPDLVGPFPYRTRGGSICYPTNGAGWYHGCEVREAQRLYGGHIRLLEAWVLYPEDGSDSPFGFIPDLYAYRAQLKSEGMAAEKCIKLGINSLYGKLAQGVGFKGSAPPFQSYYWAGAITAVTRARMLRLAAQHTDSLVMIATDGIFFSGSVTLAGESIGTDLGELEYGEITDAFTAQPGVYCGTKDGEKVARSRGFFAKEIDFEAVKAGSEKSGPDYIGRYSSTRFHGLGTALMGRELSNWRHWITSDRSLNLYPSYKHVVDPMARPVRHSAPTLPTPVVPSREYHPKGGHADDQSDYRQGKDQPLRGDF
jgi:hypothetical protein